MKLDVSDNVLWIAFIIMTTILYYLSHKEDEQKIKLQIEQVKLQQIIYSQK